MKTILILTTFIFAFANFTISQTAVQPLGAGTSADPYRVASLNNLYWITQNTSSWNKHYIQTADINATSTSTWHGGSGFSPIGYNSPYFTGTYNGQEYEIDGIYINRPTTDYIGLFGMASGATIENIGVINVNIRGRNAVGGLIGYNVTYSTVNNSYSTGSVSGNNHVGGLVGDNYNHVSISNSHSTASVTGSNTQAGGLVGYNFGYAIINNSYSTGDVNGNIHVGGLVGYHYLHSTINNSYSTGNVNGGSNVGGLLGYNYNGGTINNSYSTGNVSGNDHVGGLVGLNGGSTINNSYSRGSANGNNYVGGLVGMNSSATTNNSYSTGNVTGVSLFGGLVGWNNSNVINSFWDTQTSGMTTSAGGTGKSTAEMKTESTFTSATWDFKGETANGTLDIWAISSYYNNGYPNLDGPFTWIGNTSNNWNINSNWSPAIIPSLGDDASIPSGCTNYPVIGSSSSGDCKNISIESGASLTIQSDGSFIPTGTVTNNGNMIAQRFISGSSLNSSDYTWHSISLPVATTNAGTYFTGDYMYSYNETTDAWDNIVPTASSVERGTGYIIKTINGSKTYNFSGTLNNGSFNYNLTRNGGGYNFVGNPYPSYLDLEAISRTNLGATIYVWDPNNTNWATYQIGSGAGSLGRYLHPMQGFFIQANSGGGSIGFANNDRTHNSSGNFLKDGEIEINKLTLNASGNDLTDQLFIQEYMQENDGYEMYSMNPDVPHIFVQDNAEEFCIYNMHSEPGYSCLPIGFWCATDGDYTISIAENSFENYNLMIEDLQEGSITPISVNETFEFSYTAGSSKDRFCLHFMYLSDIETENILNYIVVGKDNGIIVKTFGELTNIEVFDINGRLLSKTTSNASESFIPISASGLYIVKLQSENNTEVRKVVVN